MYFWPERNATTGGMIITTVMHSIGMIWVWCTPLNEAKPNASVYLLRSCRKMSGPR